MKRRAVLASVILVITGCSRVTSSASDVVPEQLPLAAEPPAAAMDVPDGVKIALIRGGSLHPAEVPMADQSAVIVSDLLFDGLTEVDAEGSLRGALAQSWSVSPDQTEWRFTIDTDRISAEDVVINFDAFSRRERSRVEVVLLTMIDSVVAEDSETVLITLNRPYAGFAWLLSGLRFSMVGADGSPTGRYSWAQSPDDSSNATAPEQAAVAQLESDDGSIIDIHWFDSIDRSQAAFDDGVIHAAVLGHGGDAGGHRPTLGSPVRYVAVNPVSPHMTEVQDRLAVMGTLNRAELSAVIGDHAVIAEHLTGPLVAGTSNLAAETPPEPSLPVPEAPAGDRVLQVAYSHPHEQPLAHEIARQLSQAGMAAEAVSLDPGALITAIWSAEVDLYVYGWLAPAPVIDAIIPPLLAGDSPFNLQGPLSGEIEELVQSSYSVDDDAQRWAHLTEAMRLAIGQGYVLPLANPQAEIVMRNVDGPIQMQSDGSIRMSAGD